MCLFPAWGKYLVFVNLFGSMDFSDGTQHPSHLFLVCLPVSEDRKLKATLLRLPGSWSSGQELGVLKGNLQSGTKAKAPCQQLSTVGNISRWASKTLETPRLPTAASWESRGNFDRGRSQVHNPTSCQFLQISKHSAVVAGATSWSLGHCYKGVLLNSKVLGVASWFPIFLTRLEGRECGAPALAN